jgi:hypothetical protein
VLWLAVARRRRRTPGHSSPTTGPMGMGLFGEARRIADLLGFTRKDRAVHCGAWCGVTGSWPTVIARFLAGLHIRLVIGGVTLRRLLQTARVSHLSQGQGAQLRQP